MIDYQKIATDARRKVLDLIYRAQTSHIGSVMSAIDIMAVLFEKMDLEKDKFVLSAGWKAAALYYFLWRKGRITEEELDSFCQPGSKLIGLVEPVVNGVHYSGGSMGHGLPAAVGYALSKKLKKEEGIIYCLVSDGEMAIGTAWESFLIARYHHLMNLVIIIDRNFLQAMGHTDSILSVNLRQLATREDEIHWIDGHDYQALEKSIFCKKDVAAPKMIIANTMKGRGISFMENNNVFHYKAPNEEEYELAIKELNG